jgi:CheY-like chemotaxis protein
MHVLVVDGSAEAASDISEHLRQMGLEAVCARTLAEARQLISQRRPDLIISERKLPDGSGLEFHDVAPGTRLVLSSNNPDPNEFPPGTRILAKPVNARSMQEALRFSLQRTVKFPT